MEKKFYEQPEVEVITLISEQPVFTGSGTLENPVDADDIIDWLS